LRSASSQTELRYALHETREERHLPQLEAMTERLHSITLDLQRLNAVPEVSPPSPLPPPPESQPIVEAVAEKEQKEPAEGPSKQLSLRAAAAAPTPAEARIAALEERLARGEGMEPELGAKLTALEARLETLAAKAYAGVSAVDRKADKLRHALRENSSSRSRGGGGSSREAMMVERERGERRR
jgi:uncharacterized coiled-coil protein SlyX